MSELLQIPAFDIWARIFEQGSKRVAFWEFAKERMSGVQPALLLEFSNPLLLVQS